MMQHRSIAGDLIEIRDFATEKQSKQLRKNGMRVHHLSMASSRIANDYPELAGWYCLKVKDICEFAVEKQLEQAGVTSLVLRQGGEEVIRRGRKWLLPPRPWLRGYVLVNCVPSPSAFSGLLSVKHVVSVVGGFEKPYRIPDKSINEFKELVEKRNGSAEQKKAQEGEFLQGENIKVIDGPFASFSGVVTETVRKGSDRIKCEVTIFGRETALDLPLASVAKL